MIEIKKAVEAARKVYGADINISIARSPAFGNDDTMILVYGARRLAVAAGLARFVKGAQIVDEHPAPCDMFPAPRPYASIQYA